MNKQNNSEGLWRVGYTRQCHPLTLINPPSNKKTTRPQPFCGLFPNPESNCPGIPSICWPCGGQDQDRPRQIIKFFTNLKLSAAGPGLLTDTAPLSATVIMFGTRFTWTVHGQFWSKMCQRF